jgi:hypothetical protein
MVQRVTPTTEEDEEDMTHTNLVAAMNLSPQQKVVLGHLTRRSSISDVESRVVYNITRLSDVIYRLRRKGFNIVTDVRKDAAGHQYSRYFLAA